MARTARLIFAALLLMVQAACLGQAAAMPASGSPPNSFVPDTSNLLAEPTLDSLLTPSETKRPPSLTGRVRDENTREGIGGAVVEVQLAGRDWSDPAVKAVKAVTTSTGRYTFVYLPEGDYRVRASADNYARQYYDHVIPSSKAGLVHVSANGKTPVLNFYLGPGGSIAGTVYQQDGVSPVSRAMIQVRLARYTQDDGFYTVTGPDGSYVVEGLSNGNYKVMAEALGYAPSKYYADVYGWSNASLVRVKPPGVVTDINLKFDLPVSIAGHVYQKDGVTPIANARIVADAPGLEGGDTWSNPDGSYTIEGLIPATYVLRAYSPVKWAAEFYDDQPGRLTATRLSLSAGQQLDGINFILEPGAPIRGHIYDRATGAPIPGVQVAAELVKGGGAALAETFSDGSYILWAGAGCYRVGISSPAGAPGYVPEYWNSTYDFAAAELVCVAVPGGVKGIDFHLARAGSISGQVINQKESVPVEGARVYASSISSDYPGAETSTLPDGSYTIQGLPPGVYRVEVTASGYLAGNAGPVRVTAPEDTPDVNFALNAED